jgi:uncharacterized protein (DUF433 family)
MPLTLQPDPLPLHEDESGSIRVGGTRVTLDSVVAEHENGASPEQIVEDFNSLTLAQVYGALAYYHRHRDEVREYLRRQRVEAEALRREIEARQGPGPTRAELEARLRKKQETSAPR